MPAFFAGIEGCLLYTSSFSEFFIYDTASYARVHQHDVRAKQTKVCDAERAWFQTLIFILVLSAKHEVSRTRLKMCIRDRSYAAGMQSVCCSPCILEIILQERQKILIPQLS